MGDAVPDQEEAVSARDRYVVLSLVNTLQPDGGEVRRSLPNGIDEGRFQRVLQTLIDDRLVLAVGNDQFVVTSLGRAAIGGGPLAKRRDINRLLHLFERSKMGGEPG